MSAAFLLPLWGIRPRTVQGNDGENSDPAETGEEARGVWHDLREGITVVVQTPWLWITIGLYALTNVTLSGPYSIAMPYLVEARWHDPRVLGLLYAFFPAGDVVGSVWLGNKEVIRRRGPLIYLGTAVAGAMLGLFGLPLPIWILGVAAFVNGFALELGTLAWTNALQTLVPPDKLGRVSSVDAMGSFGLIPIGFGLTGWATDWLGAPMVFLIGGGVTAVVALLMFGGSAAVRKLD